MLVVLPSGNSVELELPTLGALTYAGGDSLALVARVWGDANPVPPTPDYLDSGDCMFIVQWAYSNVPLEELEPLLLVAATWSVRPSAVLGMTDPLVALYLDARLADEYQRREREQHGNGEVTGDPAYSVHARMDDSL